MKINYWSKVIDGRYDFFQEFLRAETDVLDIDTKDKQALQKFMEDLGKRIHRVMLNDQGAAMGSCVIN
jgi:hypothetical protein